jgi:glycosyltransferase involved in cell wall biosynthesis
MRKPVYLFINRVYPPAPGATGELLKQLAEGLVQDGARVVVVAGAHEGCPRRGKVHGVEVVRVWSPPLRRSRHWQRAMDYAVLYPQFAWHMVMCGEVEAVVSMTDPPMQMLLAPVAGWRAWRRIHWAQDVYPELAEELGVIPAGGVAARLLRGAANAALRRHDDVVVPGRCMREELIRLGVSARRIEVIPNWSPVGRAADADVAAMRRRLGWDGKFAVVYSGNFGLAHDFDPVIDAVRKLAGGRMVFVFAGDGPRLGELRSALGGAAHVQFLPSQAPGDLAAFLGAADVHLVTVRREAGGLVVPSKAYGILEAGRPLVYIGGDGDEIARVLRETGAGIVVRNDDAVGLCAVLSGLAGDADRVRRMGEAASAVAREFTRAKAVRKWKDLLH